jgi:hypothetical protein
LSIAPSVFGVSTVVVSSFFSIFFSFSSMLF